MTKLPWWKRSVMVLGAMAATVAALAIQPRQGRSAEPDPQAAGKKEFRYFGSKSCEQCHGANAAKPGPLDAGSYFKLDEFRTWSTEDKHRVAFARLTSKRGQAIASLLKVDVTQREAGCLGCHSASTTEATKQRQGNLFDPNEGVSCENCHGPISAWFGDHIQSEFRDWDAKKRADSGNIDVRVPEIQATQCLSCHVGNSSEGKVVTHEMYAAGHPPLPSIEVATFTDFIPRHWWLVAEKPGVKEAVKNKKALPAGFKAGDLEHTKLALVGAAVALKTSMKLLADEANLAETSKTPGEGWPDYARYDCWSCHHDLKRESWRQERGYQMPPGRVPVSQWPLALVNLGIDRLEMNDPAAAALRSELQKLENGVRESASNRPFGRKDEMAKATAEFANWSDVLIKKLSEATYDRAIAAKLLRKLVEKAEQSTPDYDSARHIAWMIKLLVGELGDQLQNRPAIGAILARFDEGLKLELPAGRKYEIEDQLGNALNIIGEYEPAMFKKHLKELLALLPPA